jgi:hypothetical protein
MHLIEKFHLFPGFSGEMRLGSAWPPPELACLKTAPAF